MLGKVFNEVHPCDSNNASVRKSTQDYESVLLSKKPPPSPFCLYITHTHSLPSFFSFFKWKSLDVMEPPNHNVFNPSIFIGWMVGYGIVNGLCGQDFNWGVLTITCNIILGAHHFKCHESQKYLDSLCRSLSNIPWALHPYNIVQNIPF